MGIKETDLSLDNWVCIAKQEIEGMRCSKCKKNLELRTYFNYEKDEKKDLVHCISCKIFYERID